ncbi:MAG: hypothetical protein HZA01_14465 [Nitrospinae bacterium]|nr:hypothetical protein [Nitrospinota bacterium]
MFDPSRSLQDFFIGLLSEKANFPLIEDLLAAAVAEFGQSFAVDLAGVSGVVEFVKSGKDKNLLLKMDPDKKLVVEALIREMKID